MRTQAEDHFCLHLSFFVFLPKQREVAYDLPAHHHLIRFPSDAERFVAIIVIIIQNGCYRSRIAVDPLDGFPTFTNDHA